MLYDLSVYKSLLSTFETLASDGPDAFYRGKVAKTVVDELGGAISMDDLGNYTAVETEPVQTRIGNFQVGRKIIFPLNYFILLLSCQVVAPPAPSSGPQLLAILNAMEEFKRRYGLTPVDGAYLRNITEVWGSTMNAACRRLFRSVPRVA